MSDTTTDDELRQWRAIIDEPCREFSCGEVPCNPCRCRSTLIEEMPRLLGEVDRLNAENKRLRKELANAGRGAERNAHISRELSKKNHDLRAELAALLAVGSEGAE